MHEDPAATGAPWWKHASVWLLLSGPAIVVVAGLVTAWIAASGADALVGDMAPRTRVVQQHAGERAQLPALQGRNHAATPAQP